MMIRILWAMIISNVLSAEVKAAAAAEPPPLTRGVYSIPEGREEEDETDSSSRASEIEEEDDYHKIPLATFLAMGMGSQISYLEECAFPEGDYDPTFYDSHVFQTLLEDVENMTEATEGKNDSLSKGLSALGGFLKLIMVHDQDPARSALFLEKANAYIETAYGYEGFEEK